MDNSHLPFKYDMQFVPRGLLIRYGETGHVDYVMHLDKWAQGSSWECGDDRDDELDGGGGKRG